MSEYAPIVLFVYNRPDHMTRTLSALARNDLARKSDLYIFSDAARDEAAREKVEEVRRRIDTIAGRGWFRNVFIEKAEKNRGLAASVIHGVTRVIERHGRAIVMEDDLLSAPDFLTFMNEALEFYRGDETIGSISGYSPLKQLPSKYGKDIWSACRSSSLGWGTWLDRWCQVKWHIDDFEEFSRDKKNRKGFDACGSDRFDRLRRQIEQGAESWSVRFGYWQYKAGKNTIFPARTRIQHIGWDGSGVHGTYTGALDTHISEKPIPFHLEPVTPDPDIMVMLRDVYSGSYLSRSSRWLRNNGLETLDSLLRMLMRKR